MRNHANAHTQSYSDAASSAPVPGSNGEFRRTPILIALVLGLILVVGVLIGAKATFSNAAHQPVAMGAIDSPEAQSPECAELIENLPEELGGKPRAEIADPVPPGAAAWQSSSTQRFTLRCGVHLPLQYSDLSIVNDVDGTSWLKVMDTTPQSTMQTWYVVNRFPVVAVTTDEEGLGGDEFPAAELSDALRTLDNKEADTFETPLVGLAKGEDRRCSDLMAHLPNELSTQPTYTRYDGARSKQLADNSMAAWVADGYEPIVIRCGVGFPSNYQPGAQLQSINDVPWFEDTTLGNGTTASTWFALGRSANIAVSTPQEPAQAALTTLTNVIKERTDEDSSSK